MKSVKSILVTAFIITALLFLSLSLIGELLGEKRESVIDERIKEVYTDLNEMQTFSLMSEIYGDDIACIASEKKLKDLGESLWSLGIKLDQYRVASEEFQKDPFYQEQKEIFNERQLTYLMLLTKLKKQCNSNQSIISFFYQNSEDCKKCDDQSFILTDIKEDLDDQVAIFSFDMDLNLTTIKVLKEYYEIYEYPCVIINEERFCGIQDKKFILQKMCLQQPELTECEQFNPFGN